MSEAGPERIVARTTRRSASRDSSSAGSEGIFGLDKDLDLTAAAQSYGPRFVAGHAIGDELGRAVLENALGFLEHGSFDTATAHRPGHIPRVADRHPRAERARRRTPGFDHRGDGRTFAVGTPTANIRKNVAHLLVSVRGLLAQLTTVASRGVLLLLAGGGV